MTLKGFEGKLNLQILPKAIEVHLYELVKEQQNHEVKPGNVWFICIRIQSTKNNFF